MKRLNKRIYSWYLDGDFLLLRYVCKVREELIDKLNKLDDNTKNRTLLEIIEYYYYIKKLSESKVEKE